MSRAPLDTEPRFVANLRAVRKVRGLSCRAVADGMRDYGFQTWTARTIWGVEDGQRSPKIREAEALAHIVDVPLDRMLTETPTRIVQFARQNVAGVP